ncbi:unnamed protein product [Sphagnum jensenii]|uniref:Fibronectin type III-like domain-containing protein n=1 Tax=Sphagnum jensenii TaxID=128206 RepID=A0ABP0WMQ4_9BRYO
MGSSKCEGNSKSPRLVIALSEVPYFVNPPSPPPPHLSYACDPKGDTAISALPFCDRSLTDEERVEDLISRLTVREKITQLVNTAANVSRLGIPAYEWWGEGLHGVAISPSVNFGGEVPAATSFPQPILTAGSFNTALWNSIGQVVSTEGRAIYNQGRSGLTYWSPNINIVRDPRWGRTQETPGEDPKLTSTYAVYFVKGLQEGHYDGSQTPNIGGPKRLKISACCKHFTAHDLDNWKGYDRNHFDAKVTIQDLEDTYNPPFRSCVEDGRSSSLMCSYNRVNGVPTCADYNFLTETVRNTWGLDGYIVSDCDAVKVMHESIDYAFTAEDAVADALNAGLDLNCGSYLSTYTQSAIGVGKVNSSRIDAALYNLFLVRMRLGMFDGPTNQTYGSLGPGDVCSDAHQELAVEAARQGIVLLKNRNQTLPLYRGGQTTLAVIGPNANASHVMLGNYAGVPCKYITPLQGLVLLGIGDYDKVHYAPGCLDTACADIDHIPHATEVASRADAVVLVVGLTQEQEAEFHDRKTLLLPGHQQDLISAVAGSVLPGRPVVLVVMSGGPVDISFAKADSRIQSILWVGYPGQAGGQAITEIIFGDHNPGGRLPVSWYPEMYTHIDMADMRMRPDNSSGYPGRTYRFHTGPMIYPFGYGLSYTTFAHQFASAPSAVTVPTLQEQMCGSDGGPSGKLLCSEKDRGTCKNSMFTVSVIVQNLGDRGGNHQVLLFSSPPRAGVNGAPLKQLLDFQSVYLSPGAQRELVFSIDPCRHLSRVKEDGSHLLDAGAHVFRVGAIKHSVVFL